MKKPWTPAERESLRRLYPDNPTADIAILIGRPLRQVYSQAHKLGIAKSVAFKASAMSGRIKDGQHIGSSTQFKKGQAAHNKGIRRPGYAPGRMAETQFTKGNRSGRALHNYQPIGTERICADGYLIRKVTDDHPVPARRWIGVHRLVWIEAHGPIPPDRIVVFKSGQFTNIAADISADKLELLTRSELMLRNTYHNRYPKEIGRVIQLRGAVTRQINKRVRRENKDHSPS